MTYLDIQSAYVGSDQVERIYLGADIVWERTQPTPPEPDYSAMPLTFEIISGGTIVWKKGGLGLSFFSPPQKTIEYSINEGVWTEITSTSAGTAINVATGDIISFRGNNTVYSNQNMSFSDGNMFQGTAVFKVYGNINSLIDADNFSAVSFWEKMVFTHLFKESAGLIDAENLVIQADNSNEGACKEMFYECTNLTTAPKVLLVPSFSGSSCYKGMFYHCTSLTTAPELSSTTLATSCYNEMFLGCTSLTSAPELPATTLEERCYKGMFNGCTSLTTAPELPATTLADHCYQDMFSRCTSLTTAPELPATTLTFGCYERMFSGCTSLNYVKCLATDISASYCTSDWLNNVASSGTFTKAASMNSWSTGVSGIPDGWTVQDATV